MTSATQTVRLNWGAVFLRASILAALRAPSRGMQVHLPDGPVTLYWIQGQ